MLPKPQFTAELKFHFREHGPELHHRFVFNESLHRRVPMAMDGVEGLNTIGMWIDSPGTFRAGDSAYVRCVLLAPELFSHVVKPGVKFEIWERGFLATGTVLERNEEGWPDDT